MDKNEIHDLLVLVRVRKDWPADDAMDLLGAGLVNLIVNQKLKRRKEDTEWKNLVRAKRKAGLSINDIAKELDVTRDTVRGVFRTDNDKAKRAKLARGGS